MRFFFELYFYFNGKYLDKRFCCIFAAATGDLVHLVERQVRNLKVAGSSPVISTFGDNRSTVVPLLFL